MKGINVFNLSLIRRLNQRITFNNNNYNKSTSYCNSAKVMSLKTAGGGKVEPEVQPTALAKSNPETNTDWRQGSSMENGVFKVYWLFPDGKWKMPGLANIMKWQMSRPTIDPPAPGDFPIITPDWSRIASERKAIGGDSSNSATAMGTSCTWLGHATCLFSIDDVNVLTDPVFSDRCSPVQFAGPKRYTPAACNISDLPHIHIVLISHDHYDHLDYYSIVELEEKFKPIYVVGLGLRQWFLDTNIDPSRIVEMDWWESKDIAVTTTAATTAATAATASSATSPASSVNIQFVPVQHWAKRSLGDDLTHLWGGFLVSKDGFKFFFNGDTGYHEELYKEIGKRCGPVDISAIPIGAYEPRLIMKPQHVDPDEAYLIHKHLNSRYSFGIHYGTFILTDEPLLEPVERITKIAKENPDVPPFEAINHGVTVVMNKIDKTYRIVK